MYKFGCIGIGNMGGAVAQALVQAAGGGSLMVSSRTREKAEAAAARLGCMAGDNRDLAAQCQYLFLGVKPQILPGVLEELAPVLRSRKSPCVLVSMAAGVSLARLQSLAEGCPVVRIMPNTPVSVGAGLVLYTPGEGLTKEQESQLTAALAHAGQVDMVCRLLSNVCVATSFYQRPASRVYFFLPILRNLLYLILMRLNRRIPNGMYGGVRGRLLN